MTTRGGSGWNDALWGQGRVAYREFGNAPYVYDSLGLRVVRRCRP